MSTKRIKGFGDGVNFGADDDRPKRPRLLAFLPTAVKWFTGGVVGSANFRQQVVRPPLKKRASLLEQIVALVSPEYLIANCVHQTLFRDEEVFLVLRTPIRKRRSQSMRRDGLICDRLECV